VQRLYYVYIMSSITRVIYIGVTNDLEFRVLQHKHKKHQGFTARYNVTKLVYYEDTHDIRIAIAREKQLKGWLRAKKVALIESTNPGWRDLAVDWYKV